MLEPIFCYQTIYWIIASGMSIFYGGKAIDIFLPTEHDDVVKKKNSHWYWRFHQVWLNTICSFVGWVLLHQLLFIRVIPNYPDYSLEVSDIFLVIIALLGITGMLPSILSRLTSLK